MARSIWRIGFATSRVKNNTRIRVPGTSAAVCHAETRCACRVRSRMRTSSVSMKVSVIAVNRVTRWRKVAKLAVALAAASSLTDPCVSVFTTRRVAARIEVASAVASAFSTSPAMSSSVASSVARSCRNRARLSGFLSTRYCRETRSREATFSASRRLFSAVDTPVISNCSLWAASRSRFTMAQTTATSKGRATRPKPTRISPLSDCGRGNFIGRF